MKKNKKKLTVTSCRLPVNDARKTFPGRLNYAVAALLLMTFGSGFIDPVYDRNLRGIKEYQRGNYEAAVSQFKEADKANRPPGAYNLGTALIGDKKYEEGIAVLENQLNRTTDKTALTDLYYNIGNGYFQSGNYAKAVENYKNSLRLRPDQTDAKSNLELAQAMLKQSKNQENKNKDKDGKDKNKDKDKDKKDDKNQDKDKKDQDNQDKGRKPDQNQQSQKPGQMSKDDANRLLDSFDQKKVNLIPLKEIKMNPRKVEKDW